MAENIPGVSVEDREENERLREHLADDGDMDIRACEFHELFVRLKLEFRADRVGRNEEDEEHDNAWYEKGAEVDVIAGPGVTDCVQVNIDGLEEGGYLLVGVSLGEQNVLTDSCCSERGDSLHVFVEECA